MGLKIVVANAVEAMDLKAQVQQVCGLNTFTWKFTPVVNNWLGDEVMIPATVEFKFEDEQMTTYFQLKWAK